jgi:hypothetical protein
LDFEPFSQALVGQALRLPVVIPQPKRLSLQFNARSPLYPRILDGVMIRKLKGGKYRLYSRKKNPKTGKRRNLGTFRTRAAAKKHERAIQYFKRN